MQLKQLTFLLSFIIFMISCGPRKPTSELPLNGGMQIVKDCDSLKINGSWRLVYIHDSGKIIKPPIVDTIIISQCSTIERHAAGHLVSKETFKLYRMHDATADYELRYSNNDSIGCINLIIKQKGDTLVFSECSDFETTRYFFKKYSVD